MPVTFARPGPVATALRSHPAAGGFTLIELMVVIVIVAILFTYATLAVRGNSPEEALQKEALRFDRLVELALEESILRGEEYAIEIFIDGYRFYRFEATGWVPLSDDNLLRDRRLPEEMEVEISLEETEIVINPGASLQSDSTDTDDTESLAEASEENSEQDPEQDQSQNIKPQIFLLSSGEISPAFDVRFFIPGNETSYFVRGRFDGKLETGQNEF